MGGETSAPLFIQCVMQTRTGTSALSALPASLKAGEIFFFFANRKSYILSVISGYSVKYINSFHNSIRKQFHMFMSVCLYVKLVGRIMPKFEFHLKVLIASSFH